MSVSMAPDDAAWGRGNSGADIPFSHAIGLNKSLALEYLCSAVEYAGSDQTDYYILRSGNKRNVVVHSSTWGSGGAGDQFTIDYAIEPVKEKAMDALKGTCNRTAPMSPSSNLYWYGLTE